MAKRTASDAHPPEGLDEQELAEAHGEPLPDRHALTLIRGVEPLPVPVVPDDGGGLVGIDPPPNT